MKFKFCNLQLVVSSFVVLRSVSKLIHTTSSCLLSLCSRCIPIVGNNLGAQVIANNRNTARAQA